MSKDVGNVLYVKERKAEITAGQQSSFPQTRCVILKISNSKTEYAELYKYIVSICYSDKPIVDYEIGEWVDSKVISGFSDRKKAEDAYSAFGPAYLSGERITWSVLKRIE